MTETCQRLRAILRRGSRSVLVDTCNDQQIFLRSTEVAAPAVGPSNDPAQRARENLVHVLLNHNDFVTVR